MADEEQANFQEATMGTGLRATLMELRRVVWPTREELFRMTAVVIGTVLAVAIFIASIDALLTRGTTFLYGST